MQIERIKTWNLPLAAGLIMGLLLLVFAVTGCDEGMQMGNDVITDPPKEPTTNGEATEKPVEPVEPEPEPEPIPEPTVAIGNAVQQDDGSITVSGTSTDVPEGTVVTVTLGDTVTATTTTDGAGAWTVTVPVADTEALTAGTVTVTAVADEATDTDSLIITEPEVPTSTVTLPPGYALPPELIPATPPTLSADEAALIKVNEKVRQQYPDFDVTAPKLQTQAGHTADLISLLPYKEREEVYELFVASVNFPSFAQAAERMKEINVRLIILNGEAVENNNWDEYWDYSEKVSIERGFLGQDNLTTLTNIYFEEVPKDKPYSYEGISYYWIILEYYRLQLENPDLQNLYKKNNPTELLKLFRQSCKKGYVFGLDNPWE